MNRKLAIKKLTASDLTLFKWQFENLSAGNQKAINLNRGVFIDSLYPSLPSIAEASGWRISIDLYIFGPGPGGEYNLQRKIIKGGTYKNWRLDGEFIDNPTMEPERFNILEPDDFVLIEFSGEIQPVSAKLLFISQNVNADREIHAFFRKTMQGKSMKAIDTDFLEKLVKTAVPSDSHPIQDFLLLEQIIDASMGGFEGIQRLVSSPTYQKVTHQDLRSARALAEEVGRRGEELVNDYLYSQKEAGVIKDFEWIAAENAIAPYDFSVLSQDDETINIDVKSTTGRWSSRIHISYNELLQMTVGAEQYDIYRVYDISQSGALLKIASNIRSFGESIVSILEQLPDGIRSNGISVNPDNLKFGEEIVISPIVED
ncbi:MAG: DUF3883 domain-containing protein [Chloroflexi bacterium]|nr:MAG: DUF3883 domain-containing protein [Chloroflexota bacterium]MBL1197052.1 DUF3883 domain-containing protein [Chloroflexota bacterium]NOH14347.1 DUF3883 domain-containing protein [Chloroflexota bacterium]